MRKIFLAIAMAMFSLIVISTYTLAQVKDNQVIYGSGLRLKHYDEPDRKIPTEVYINNIHLKATRNFARSFKNVTSEKWYKTEGGFIASFKENEIKTEVFYNEKGSWLYNILTYQEDKLISAVRALIKNKYNDYAIVITFEQQFYDGPVYIVHLKKATTYKTVLVSDGEIRIVDEFHE